MSRPGPSGPGSAAGLKSKTRPTALIVVTNIAVLAVGLAIVELTFGPWLSADRLNRLNLVRNRTLVYNVSHLYDSPSPTIRYSRDKYGLRGDYGGDPARIELLTVGGSTTDQRSIPDEATWQDVLSARAAAAGMPVVVANAGVDGQSTIGHIRNFDWWFPHVPRLKPKRILFFVGLNDVHVEPEEPSDTLEHDSLMSTIRDNSALWYLVRTVRGMFRATRADIGHRRVEFATLQWTGTPRQHDYEFLKPRLDAYAQRIGILVARTRSLGAEPIFVTQPSRQFKTTAAGIVGRADEDAYDDRHTINGVDYYRMTREFDRVLAEVCRHTGAAFIDLAAEPIWDDGDFYDFEHMTPAGAAKVGTCLFERLTRPAAVASQEKGPPCSASHAG